MVYGSLADVFRDFMALYVPPSCCGRLHWSPGELDAWLRLETTWDGQWRHLSPALVEKAAAASGADPCPHGARETAGAH
jgi:hypothetical protein